MRVIARETLFKLIFSTQFDDAANDELKTSLYKSEKLSQDDIAYCDGMLKIIEEHKEQLLEEIDSLSVSFPESRIFPADKSILMIALAEIRFCPDIPKKVSVNEAANMASKYSSPKSASFISGLLSSLVE